MTDEMAGDLTSVAFAVTASHRHHCRCRYRPRGIPPELPAVAAPGWQPHPATVMAGVRKQMGMNRVSVEDSAVTADAIADHCEAGGPKAMVSQQAASLGIVGWTEALCIGRQTS